MIAAAVNGCPGFNAGDVAWLLENAPGEIVVLRSAGAGTGRSGVSPAPERPQLALVAA